MFYLLNLGVTALFNDMPTTSIISYNYDISNNLHVTIKIQCVPLLYK